MPLKSPSFPTVYGNVIRSRTRKHLWPHHVTPASEFVSNPSRKSVFPLPPPPPPPSHPLHRNFREKTFWNTSVTFLCGHILKSVTDPVTNGPTPMKQTIVFRQSFTSRNMQPAVKLLRDFFKRFYLFFSMSLEEYSIPPRLSLFFSVRVFLRFQFREENTPYLFIVISWVKFLF